MDKFTMFSMGRFMARGMAPSSPDRSDQLRVLRFLARNLLPGFRVLAPPGGGEPVSGGLACFGQDAVGAHAGVYAGNAGQLVSQEGIKDLRRVVQFRAG